MTTWQTQITVGVPPPPRIFSGSAHALITFITLELRFCSRAGEKNPTNCITRKLHLKLSFVLSSIYNVHH